MINTDINRAGSSVLKSARAGLPLLGGRGKAGRREPNRDEKIKEVSRGEDCFWQSQVAPEISHGAPSCLIRQDPLTAKSSRSTLTRYSQKGTGSPHGLLLREEKLALSKSPIRMGPIKAGDWEERLES